MQFYRPTRGSPGSPEVEQEELRDGMDHGRAASPAEHRLCPGTGILVCGNASFLIIILIWLSGST